MRLTVIIPTYNEKDNLLPLVSRLKQALESKTDAYELLFIDDSTDETPALLSRMSAEDPHVRFMHRSEKSGLASAVVCGFDNACGDVLAVMDADLQHPPELLPDMLTIIDEGADVVLPSRYIGGGESEGLSPIRTLASKSAKYAAKILLPSMKHVSDPMSGFFMFRRNVIADAKLNPIGWKILMEVLAMGKYQRVVEIPYGFEKRNAGESKLSLRVTLEYFMHILSLASRGIQERSKYTFLLACLLSIAVDVLAFAALRAFAALPLHVAASISGCVAGLMQCVYQRIRRKPVGSALAYGATLVVLVSLKNAFVFLLSMTGLAVTYINLWAVSLAMLAYGLFIHRRLWGRADEQVVYEVRTSSK